MTKCNEHPKCNKYGYTCTTYWHNYRHGIPNEGIKGRRPKTQTACKGMTDAEVNKLVAKKYADFCAYRWEISGKSMDRRTNLFAHREFDGYGFTV